MAFSVGQNRMRNGATATVTTQLDGSNPKWLMGYYFERGQPISARWHPTSGVSNTGRDFDLVPNTGEVWVAVFYPGRGGKPLAAVAETEAKAEAIAARLGQRIAVLGPVAL